MPHRGKLGTQQGRRIYSLRKENAEAVIGQIKQVRGFRQFGLRGLDKVSAEWILICLTHNLLKEQLLVVLDKKFK